MSGGGGAVFRLGTVCLLGSSASPEVWEGTPETFPKGVLTPFPGRGLGEEKGGHSLIHNTQRGWTKGLEEAQRVWVQFPSCRKTEGKGEGRKLAPQQPSPRDSMCS